VSTASLFAWRAARLRNCSAVNLASIIEGHPDDAVALVSRGRSTTYGQLRQQVGGLRGGLAGLGLQPGDRVGIIAANNWYFVVSYLAVLGAGCVAVPVNPSSPVPEVTRELAAVGARAVIAGPQAMGTMAALDRGALPDLDHLIASNGDELDGAVLLDDLLTAAEGPLVDRAPDDLAVLIFTSGTAGSPKAAQLTHGNLSSNLAQCQAHPGRAQTAEDVAFGVLPFFHIFGLNVVLGLTFAAGATVVTVERFDPQTGLETIATHGVTVISGAPSMWHAWASLPGAPADAFATVRLGTSGAARLSPETRQAMADRFGLVVTEGYGLTEASPVVSSGHGLDAPAGSIGVPLPGVHVRLVDADGQDALVGDAGEIWVQGPNVFPGYWEDPEATAAALTPDGWLRTGDVAVMDDAGFLFLVDRAKDLIIVSGFNVYPAEVEEVLLLHPAVERVAVVGVPHPHSGEAVKAFVVVAPGRSVEEDELIHHCEAHLARYKCPQKVMFVDEIPQSFSGKVLRKLLR
jgi:long-chain acyl-CoA synthetase